jgi:hypothetical protein
MEIKGHGLECTLEFSQPDNEGWLTTAVNVVVPHFEGSFSCSVEISELKQLATLLADLDNALGEEVEMSWGNMEGNVYFAFHLDKRGSLSVAYTLSPNNSDLAPALSGGFEADQSFLTGWLRQTEQTLKSLSQS